MVSKLSLPRERDAQRKREHSKGWVLGRGMVKGVTVGIHYLTVYCHSCGLRFCSGQEQHLWCTSVYILYVYACSDTRYLPSETRLKSQTSLTVLFRLVSLDIFRSKIFYSLPIKFLISTDVNISLRISYFNMLCNKLLSLTFFI